MTSSSKELKKQQADLRRLLKLLASKVKSGFGIVTEDDRLLICKGDRTHSFTTNLINSYADQRLLRIKNGRMFITSLGLETLRVEMGFSPSVQRNNVIKESRMIDNAIQTVLVNQEESPLYRLHTRNTKSGKPYLTTSEFSAGERFRRDFECGQLQPRITARIEGATGSSGKGGGYQAHEISDFAMDARKRVEKAIGALGPELSDVALDVCCFLKGLEQVERERSWPPRSAKLMLRTCLRQLARHYGVTAPENRRTNKIHTWSSQDNRPSIGPG